MYLLQSPLHEIGEPDIIKPLKILCITFNTKTEQKLSPHTKQYFFIFSKKLKNVFPFK